MNLFSNNASLFQFQREDVLKLASQRSRLIANDMGTGKTYVGLALDLVNRQELRESAKEGQEKFSHMAADRAKTLIVCPKSVISVWDEHCMELTTLDVTVIDPKKRQQFLDDALNPKIGGYFICHWDSLRFLTDKDKVKGRKTLQDVPWFHVIGDEVHRAKNRKAQMTRALKKIRPSYTLKFTPKEDSPFLPNKTILFKTGMSGTPADNKPQDLWSILHWLFPFNRDYSSYWRFVNEYCVMERSPEGYFKMIGVQDENIKKLHTKMLPWYTRRRKEDVLTDLPNKYYSTLWVDLGSQQRRAYDQMKKTMVAWVGEHQEEIEQGDPIIAQAVVSQLVRLQQFAVGYVVPRKDKNGEPMYRWDKKNEEWKPLFDMVEPSAKLDVVMEILEDNPDEQFVIFSQFRTAIDLLQKRLEDKKITYGLLTGMVSQEDRAQAVQEFQSGRLRVFIGTIAAGGVGITLTAASTVIFIDRAWSPAINKQAEDRLHRIGQTEAVQVIDLMAKNTVDLGRRQKVAQKWEWIQKILGDKVDQNALALELKQEEGEKE